MISGKNSEKELGFALKVSNFGEYKLNKNDI